MGELLLELLSEEIPARMQARAAADLKRLVCAGLDEAKLAYDRAESFVTPRRLALVVGGLPAMQPDVTEERKGPRTDAPEKAVQGFLKANGLDSVDQCETRDTGKGSFYFVVRDTKGAPVADLLPGLLGEALQTLPWPKSMRWGTGSTRWVRPIQGLLCLLDGAVLPLEFAGAGAGAATRGHRFLAPEPFAVTGFGDYRDKLAAAHVILDAGERRKIIAAQAEKIAAAEGLRPRADEALLDEVAGLVEWPVVLMGAIDAPFMAVPPEVLITSMRTHQKYFSLEAADGRLAPKFLVVANMVAGDGGAAITAGNERVLRARLSDAKFFWDQDRARKLEGRVPALADVIFHEKLGSVADKVARIEALAVEIAAFVPGADIDQTRSAATLCKADLTTGMVGEFPELQGLMGRYYALEEGERPAVADAIAEHYAPLGPADACPGAPVSVAVALADKIDTLVGFFAIDARPTGSKDPFALRRAALGVIRLVVENRLRLPLKSLFDEASRLYGDAARGFRSDDLLAFFADRLKVHLREEGVRHDLISAVFALGGEDDLVRLLARVDALRDFLASEDGANLLTAYSRAANILRIEEKRDGASHAGPPDAALIGQAEEAALLAAIDVARPAIAAAVAGEDFAAAMAALAGLRGPVDTFFDAVTVNCDDPALRANRLRLLSGIRGALDGVADFSLIEG